MNIGFIPIDNRPVCYTLAEQIAKIDNSIHLYLPPREYLGDLTKYADIENLFDWLEAIEPLDALILSLDTLAYGGLIPSRRCAQTFDEIKARVLKLKKILEKQNAKVYAFSSIMRISNNNVNEEEKEYWSKWGKKIFDYSYQTHKLGCESCISNIIPSEIIDDYLNTRKRNFEINKIYLEWQKQGIFETLIFSKDDCAQYGFNVQEAQALEALGGKTKTGADEIPLTLLARSVKKDLKIAPIFLEPDFKNLISNYEDVSIEASVKGQIELCGCTLACEDEADILLYVNNFKYHQGEIVMKVDTEPFRGTWKKPDKPYMIADVRFANGADNSFVEEFFKSKPDENFFGYSAWNTSANTLGSLICAAKVKFFAQNYNAQEFRKLQAIRLLDDWVYQANCRQQAGKPDVKSIKNWMKPYEKQVFEFIGQEFSPTYGFPWNRLFEIEVEL